VFTVRSAYARGAKERLENEGFTIGPADEWRLRGRISLEESA
jgi:hypothetical protein